MLLTAQERILAAIELNPDRSRVTLRRDDARQLLADNQRLAADALQLKATNAEQCSCLSEMADRMIVMDVAIQGLERRPTWLGLWLSWAMLPAAAFAGALVHHG